ncbi:MAG: methyltransferase [Pseudomonadota bacterium]
MTTIDAVLGGRIMIEQPTRGLRAGHDAILLAAIVPAAHTAQRAETVVELGSGSGVAGLCALMRRPQSRLIGIDCEPALVEIAQRNAARNALAAQARFVEADCRRPAEAARRANVAPGCSDHVLMNPPYFDDATVRTSPDLLRGRAVSAGGDTTERWVRCAAHFLRAGGSLSIVHSAHALSDVLRALDGRFGDVRIKAVHTRPDRPAKRILVQALRDRRTPLQILPPLILADPHGNETPLAQAILRNGEPLAMSV